MNLYDETIKRYGVTIQLDVLIEECAELIQVIQKWKRMEAKTPNANVSVADIIGEAVDVEIMLEQLRHIFRYPSLWKKIKQQKLDRMEERLK